MNTAPDLQREAASYDSLPSMGILKDAEEKLRLIKNGLPIDWLIRANSVSNLETLIYLSKMQERFEHENAVLIADILQDHEKRGGKLIPDNNPPVFTRRRSNEDSLDAVKFISRLLSLIEKETVIWDRIGDPNFGYHRQMRQAWCDISLKLGGWGSMQHVQMIKSVYRRKRDQFNSDVVRSQGTRSFPFQYTKQMSFLRPVLEMTNSLDVIDTQVKLQDYMEIACPGMDIEEQIKAAPLVVQDVMSNCKSFIDKLQEKYGDEALCEFLGLCCEDNVVYREASSQRGLEGPEWNAEPNGYESYEEESQEILDNSIARTAEFVNSEQPSSSSSALKAQYFT